MARLDLAEIKGSAISLRQGDSCSFDHLIGADKQDPRDHETERLGRVEIDDEIDVRSASSAQTSR
jgi:hypothetical protein